jgi:hypothetical protein
MALLLDRGENPSFAAGYDDAGGDDDDGQCHLLSGVFAYSIQGLLGLVSISSLLVKRRLESPRRPVVVWLLDVSKQCVGGFFIHFSNIVVSEWLQASRATFASASAAAAASLCRRVLRLSSGHCRDISNHRRARVATGAREYRDTACHARLSRVTCCAPF